MPVYRVEYYRNNTYHETGYVEVHAPTEDEAEEKAGDMEIEWNNDDTLYKASDDVEHSDTSVEDTSCECAQCMPPSDDEELVVVPTDTVCDMRKAAEAHDITSTGSKSHKLVVEVKCARCGDSLSVHNYHGLYCWASNLNPPAHPHKHENLTRKRVCPDFMYLKPAAFYSFLAEDGSTLDETTLCEEHAADTACIEVMQAVAEAGGAWDGNEMHKIGTAGKSEFTCLVCKREAKLPQLV